MNSFQSPQGLTTFSKNEIPKYQYRKDSDSSYLKKEVQTTSSTGQGVYRYRAKETEEEFNPSSIRMEPQGQSFSYRGSSLQSNRIIPKLDNSNMTGFTGGSDVLDFKMAPREQPKQIDLFGPPMNQLTPMVINPSNYSSSSMAKEERLGDFNHVRAESKFSFQNTERGSAVGQYESLDNFNTKYGSNLDAYISRLSQKHGFTDSKTPKGILKNATPTRDNKDLDEYVCHHKKRKLSARKSSQRDRSRSFNQDNKSERSTSCRRGCCQKVDQQKMKDLQKNRKKHDQIKYASSRQSSAKKLSRSNSQRSIHVPTVKDQAHANNESFKRELDKAYNAYATKLSRKRSSNTVMGQEASKAAINTSKVSSSQISVSRSQKGIKPVAGASRQTPTSRTQKSNTSFNSTSTKRSFTNGLQNMGGTKAKLNGTVQSMKGLNTTNKSQKQKSKLIPPSSQRSNKNSSARGTSLSKGNGSQRDDAVKNKLEEKTLNLNKLLLLLQEHCKECPKFAEKLERLNII